ncbi:MAG: ATP-dependent Clp protease ATP-binding subunit [Porphyromonas sp.]|nr:ATP-dependent Clp protease ATP-binding subunit [Porphyromonas sp.]
MTYNYTDKFRIAMELSFQRARELESLEVTPDLLLYGIIKEGSPASLDYLRSKGVNTETLLERYDAYLEETTKRAPEEEPSLGEEARVAIVEAVRLCGGDDKAVGPIHLMRAVLESDSDTFLKRQLASADANTTSSALGADIMHQFADAIRKAMGHRGVENSAKRDDAYDDDDDDELAEADDKGQSTQGRSSSRSERSKSKTPMLDRFGRDITALARASKLDPVIGRELEIERMSQILGRRRKSNPILIGEPGVGKTSLVEGLALRIVAQAVPVHLIHKRIIELDLSAVVAGTKYRGQFEERIKGIITELESSSDVIIYIDEIHTMIGAGGASGSMDAANLLKPALARGRVQCIGATTLEEYRKHIEKDGALERRFQRVLVEPSTPEETLEILRQLRTHYEEHHRVRYTEEALSAMVDYAERYLNDRHFPDKAIDLMDEAGAKEGSRTVEPEELSPVAELEQERNDYTARKLAAITEQKYELAASYRSKELMLEEAIIQAQEQFRSRVQDNYPLVSAENVAEVIAMMTSIPVQRIAGGELQRLKELEQRLRRRVIGQDQAVETLARSIKRSRLGLRDAKRPIGSFMFLGPTGVGKTFLVKCLAEELFGTSDALIRVDMSEYMEKFAVSRLVGAPPGYVGHDEGGQLTEQVRRKPYSIVLFDEIEKAHADVYNLMLQLLDEGYLTDSYGRKVDFRNTIIVITSNVGSREARSFGRSIGYHDGSQQEERSRDIIQKALKKTFSPEFLNRIDDIITFSQLDEGVIRQIVEVELRPLRERLERMGYSLEIDHLAMDMLAKVAYDPEYGARPLRRTLQSEVEDRLTDLILEEVIRPGATLKLTAEEGKIVLDKSTTE